MIRLPYSVTEDIITKIRSIPKDRILETKTELQTTEPVFYKWLKDSVKQEISELRYSGITIPSDEQVRYLGGIIVQAKIEGFLIGLASQDTEWSNKFLLDDETNITSFSNPLNSLLEGKLDERYYIKIKESLTDDEKNNINHWKNKALSAFLENKTKRQNLKNAASFLSDNLSAPTSNLSPDIGITP